MGFDVMIKDSLEEPTLNELIGSTAPVAAVAPTIVVEIPPAQPESQNADDFLLAEQPEQIVVVAELSPEPAAQPALSQQPVLQQGVAAKLLAASLNIVRQVVERKYRSAFGETAVAENLAEMINRLNDAHAFSRIVDGALLLQAEEAAKKESLLSEAEYAKTIEEVAYLLSYA
jgi:hypothetical protein